MGHPHGLQVDSDGSPAGSLLAYLKQSEKIENVKVIKRVGMITRISYSYS